MNPLTMTSLTPFSENSYVRNVCQKKHFSRIKCLLITFLLFSAFRDFGQTVQTFTSSGSWTCPAGITFVTVECWGGGGAGGGVQTNGNVKASGGAGGAYAQKVIAVSSGTSYTYTVGLGGIGGSGDGPAGANSWFSSNTTVLAAGGQGGGANNSTNPGLGTITGSIGTIIYKGGDGGSGNSIPGAGGGGAGSSGNGGSAMTTSPYSGGIGTATGGGNGGNGLVSNGDGLPGTSAGGGGSGASNTGNINRNGGSGANGQIVITYYLSPTITNLSADICAGGSITITGTNFVGITASNVKIGGISVTSITSFTSTQIVAVVGSACSGTVSVTTPGGTATSAGTFTCYSIPTVSATTTYTCVGGSSGTITASGSGGSTPYTYSLNGGSYQTSNLFTGLAANTYTLTIKSNSGCTSSTSVTVDPYPTSTDNQNLTGADSWIGHAHDGTNFSNYIGHFTEAETFNEGFGGDYNCFSVASNASTSTIYTETFSVKFRMNSTRKGLYVVDLGSDDGSRLTVDGNLIYNN